MVLRNLAEEVSSYNPHLAEARRKELREGQLAVVNTLFSFCVSVISGKIDASAPQPSDVALIKEGLACLDAYLEWVPAEVPFSHDCLRLMCVLVTREEHCLAVVQSLNTLLDRKSTSIPESFHPQIPAIWDALLSLLQQLAPIPFDSKVLTLTKLLQVISTLTKNFAPLISSSSPEYEALRTRLLSTLGLLLSNPSIKVSLAALQIWTMLVRSSGGHIIKTEIRKEVFKSLLGVCAERLVRADKHPEDELDTPEQIQHTYSAFRNTNMHLIEHMARLCPCLCLEFTLNRYRSLFAGPCASVTATSPNKEQACQFFEAAGTLIESILRAVTTIPLNISFIPTTMTRQAIKLREITTEIVATLVQFNPTEPSLQTTRLRQLALLGAFYSYHPEALSSVFEQVFAQVNFRSPGDSGPIDRMSEEVMLTRLTACKTLIAIAKKVSTLPMDTLVKRVLDLLPMISQLERAALFEFLVLASKSITDPQKQAQFVLDVLKDSIEFLQSDQLKMVLQDHNFMNLIGLSALEQREREEHLARGPEKLVPSSSLPADHPRLLRERLSSVLNTCASVLAALCGERNESSLSGAMSTNNKVLADIIPTVFRLLSATLRLWHPQVQSMIPLHMKPILAQSLAEILLSEVSKDGLAYDVWKWIGVVVSKSISLVATAVQSMGPSFFTIYSAQTIADHICVHFSWMSLYHLNHLLEELFVPLATSCPPNAYASHLLPIAHAVLTQVQERVTGGWALCQQYQQVSVNLEQEKKQVLDEKEVMDLLRAFWGSWAKIIKEPELIVRKGKNVLSGEPVSPKELENQESLTMIGKFVLCQESLWKPLLIGANACLHIPDSNSRRKTVLLLALIIPRVADNESFHSVFCDILTTCLELLHAISVDVVMDVSVGGGETDVIRLVGEIYRRILPFSTAPRDRLTAFLTKLDDSKSGIFSQDLANLEGLLMSPGSSERARRKSIKAFMSQYVIGKGVPR